VLDAHSRLPSPNPSDAIECNAGLAVDAHASERVSEGTGPDKEANWLPAPEDEFILMLRTYWPKEEAP
jgi:hypothetical protein